MARRLAVACACACALLEPCCAFFQPRAFAGAGCSGLAARPRCDCSARARGGGVLALCARRPSTQNDEHVYTAAEIEGLMSGMSEIENDHQRRRQLKHERLGKQLPSTSVDRRLHKRAVAHAMSPAAAVSPAEAVLADVRVILIGTKMPVTAGMVARACASFEVGELVFVAPRTNPLLRSALRASKGALQHSRAADKLAWRVCDSLDQALEDTGHVVAMTRLQGTSAYINAVSSSELEDAQGEADAEGEGGAGGAGGVSATLLQKQMQGLKELAQTLRTLRSRRQLSPGDTRRVGGDTLALVFGREDTGFTNEELEREDVQGLAAIPMSSRFGTESLSLSQAVPIVLARLFEDLQHQDLEGPDLEHGTPL
eukprot:Tamp_18960.p1 GENE.Tamp_18960~~Tamp_18960.p1  ORF type:complete len:370 (+),score=52.06 Tamp_18960:3-1112(+)